MGYQPVLGTAEKSRARASALRMAYRTKRLLLTLTLLIAVSVIAAHRAVAQTTIPIELPFHHLGDGAGNEGTSFTKSFSITSSLREAVLELNIFHPNYESPPEIYINGQSVGSIQQFFPPLNPADTASWQTNGDGSHDYIGTVRVVVDVTELVDVGENTFRIENGRPDDDYFFGLVALQVEEAPSDLFMVLEADFDDVVVNSRRRGTLELTNTGETPITITGIDDLQPEWTVYRRGQGGAEIVLQPGDTIRYDVVFRPLEEGDRSTVLLIRTDQGTYPYEVTGTARQPGPPNR
ncbi:MAG TPA: hypothetical protein VM490_13240 [Armatimonadaceae bacterium]|nr:hypothetical protein [Armatimonadaceae bacterium]